MRTSLLTLTLSLMIGTALTSLANAQETTGTPGAPNATTTIDGNYLPPPPPRFGGEIGLDAKDSKPYWSPNGRSTSPRISVEPDRAWRSRGRLASRTRAAFDISFTT